MPRRNYTEGQWFLIRVPEKYLFDAPDHRFGAGVVARGKRGPVVFAYIFGPWRREPEREELAALRPGNELLTLLMPDDWLRDGRFPLLTLDPDFSRDHWPMPEFGMYMGGDNRAVAIRTSDDSPFEPVSRRAVSPEEVRALPQWAHSAYANIFRKLADPRAPIALISDLYGQASARATGKQGASGHQVQVDFVLVTDDERTADQLREALATLGWSILAPSAAAERESGGRWMSGVKRIPSSAEISTAELDREMEAIAASLPGVEYDGHGIALTDE